MKKTTVKETARFTGAILIGLGVCAVVMCFLILLVKEAGIVGLILAFLLILCREEMIPVIHGLGLLLGRR